MSIFRQVYNECSGAELRCFGDRLVGGGAFCSCPEGQVYNGTFCTPRASLMQSPNTQFVESPSCVQTADELTCKCHTTIPGLLGPVARNCNSTAYPCPGALVLFQTAMDYRCACEPGYEVQGQNCTNIDECSRSGSCQQHELCNDTIGSYQCYPNPTLGQKRLLRVTTVYRSLVVDHNRILRSLRQITIQGHFQ
eukprot:scpid104520/ scgid4261/ Fibrillin-1